MDPPEAAAGRGADRPPTARWPSVKVLYVSEANRTPRRDDDWAPAGVPRVETPFTAEVLCQKVREALDGRTTHA